VAASPIPVSADVAMTRDITSFRPMRGASSAVSMVAGTSRILATVAIIAGLQSSTRSRAATPVCAKIR
jgi:hypothetical protein